MGFELRAFLGRASDLRTWQRQVPAAVVCALSGELAMVPATGVLEGQLQAQLGKEDPARRWAAQASRGTAVAYVDLFEFGDMGHEHASVWKDGREVLAKVRLREALDYLSGQAGFDLGAQPIDLERHRGETAAEKWAAEAARQEPA